MTIGSSFSRPASRKLSIWNQVSNIRRPLMPRTVAPLKMMSLGRSSATGSDGQAEQGGGAAVAQGAEALADGAGVAAHFQEDLGALVVRQLAGLVGPGCRLATRRCDPRRALWPAPAAAG